MSGETQAGSLQADTLAAARQLLRERGLFPLALTQNEEKSAGGGALAMPVFGGRRVTKADLMLLTKQLVIMSRSGVELADGLQNVASGCRNPTLKKALLEIHTDLTEGKAFSVAMRRQIHIFGDAYVASVAAGEAAGRVPDVLSRQADVLQNSMKLASAVKGAIAYPIVLMAVCCLVTAALLLFVLPNFDRVFKDLEVTPPASTQFLLYCSTELRTRFWLWGGLAVGAVVLIRKVLWTRAVQRSVNNAALRMYLLGEVLQSLVAGRLCVMLGTMIQSGVPLTQALQLCRSAMTNVCFQELLDRMQNEVLNGRGIAKTMSSASFVPSGIGQMVGTAEQSGNLGPVMTLVGEFYEEEGQRKIQDLAKMLEPAIVIVMGCVVSFVVASIVLPLLDISSSGAH